MEKDLNGILAQVLRVGSVADNGAAPAKVVSPALVPSAGAPDDGGLDRAMPPPLSEEFDGEHMGSAVSADVPDSRRVELAKHLVERRRTGTSPTVGGPHIVGRAPVDVAAVGAMRPSGRGSDDTLRCDDAGTLWRGEWDGCAAPTLTRRANADGCVKPTQQKGGHDSGGCACEDSPNEALDGRLAQDGVGAAPADPRAKADVAVRGRAANSSVGVAAAVVGGAGRFAHDGPAPEPYGTGGSAAGPSLSGSQPLFASLPRDVLAPADHLQAGRDSPGTAPLMSVAWNRPMSGVEAVVPPMVDEGGVDDGRDIFGIAHLQQKVADFFGQSEEPPLDPGWTDPDDELEGGSEFPSASDLVSIVALSHPGQAELRLAIAGDEFRSALETLLDFDVFPQRVTTGLNFRMQPVSFDEMPFHTEMVKYCEGQPDPEACVANVEEFWRGFYQVTRDSKPCSSEAYESARRACNLENRGDPLATRQCRWVLKNIACPEVLDAIRVAVRLRDPELDYRGLAAATPQLVLSMTVDVAFRLDSATDQEPAHAGYVVSVVVPAGVTGEVVVREGQPLAVNGLNLLADSVSARDVHLHVDRRQPQDVQQTSNFLARVVSPQVGDMAITAVKQFASLFDFEDVIRRYLGPLLQLVPDISTVRLGYVPRSNVHQDEVQLSFYSRPLQEAELDNLMQPEHMLPVTGIEPHPRVRRPELRPTVAIAAGPDLLAAYFQSVLDRVEWPRLVLGEEHVSVGVVERNRIETTTRARSVVRIYRPERLKIVSTVPSRVGGDKRRGGYYLAGKGKKYNTYHMEWEMQGRTHERQWDGVKTDFDYRVYLWPYVDVASNSVRFRVNLWQRVTNRPVLAALQELFNEHRVPNEASVVRNLKLDDFRIPLGDGIVVLDVTMSTLRGARIRGFAGAADAAASRRAGRSAGGLTRWQGAVKSIVGGGESSVRRSIDLGPSSGPAATATVLAVEDGILRLMVVGADILARPGARFSDYFAATATAIREAFGGEGGGGGNALAAIAPRVVELGKSDVIFFRIPRSREYGLEGWHYGKLAVLADGVFVRSAWDALGYIGDPVVHVTCFPRLPRPDAAIKVSAWSEKAEPPVRSIVSHLVRADVYEAEISVAVAIRSTEPAPVLLGPPWDVAVVVAAADGTVLAETRQFGWTGDPRHFDLPPPNYGVYKVTFRYPEVWTDAFIGLNVRVEITDPWARRVVRSSTRAQAYLVEYVPLVNLGFTPEATVRANFAQDLNATLVARSSLPSEPHGARD